MEEKKNKTPEERETELLEYLTVTPTAQVLKDTLGGKEPLPADVKFAKELKQVHGLPLPVINVLIQYVLLRTDMKLTKNYAEKIASHWKRKNIKTAKDAMVLARKEHQHYLQWKNEGQTKKKPKINIDNPYDLNAFDLKYFQQTKTMYRLDDDIVLSIMEYTKNLNQGLMVTWFTDRVTEYIVKHKPADKKATEALLNEFHEKYVIPFGR